jgi:hypothetical protein
LERLEDEEKVEKNKQKVNNFLVRMKIHEYERQEKLEALRFLEDKYDSRNKQLKYYPKINKRLATQKNRNWKDVDGFDQVP